MLKNRNEEELKRSCLVDYIMSRVNKRVVLSVLIALFIAISFSYPVVGEVSTISIVTDSSWKCLDAEVDGWTSVDFDDSYWENAKVLDVSHPEGFEKAKAIWYPEEPMPHTSYFRKDIVIDGEIISGKIICYQSNSEYSIYVNDNFVGEIGAYWFVDEKEFDIGSYLKEGKNVIAVKVDSIVNAGDSYVWGIVGTIRAAPASTLTPSPFPASTITPTPLGSSPTTTGDISTISIVTDSSWKSLDAEVDGWTSVDFDDSYWENAKVLYVSHPEGFEKAKAIWYPEEPMRHTSYFRRVITIDGEITSGKIICYQRNSKYSIYVNDNFVGEMGGAYWFVDEKEFDIGSYLEQGKNVIAVKVDSNFAGDSYVWGIVGTIKAAPVSTLTPSPSAQQTPTPVVSPTTYEYPTSTLKPGEPYVHLYGHKTDVTIGEVVILYLSVVNPITSPGTLKVQLTLQVPSGWSITSSEFSPPVGGFQTAVYDIEQGPDSKTIGIHMLANQPFDGVITGYTDYYFTEEPESKYHGEINEPVTATQIETSPPTPLLPSVTPNGGMSIEVKSIIVAVIVATIGGVFARVIWSHTKGLPRNKLISFIN